MHRGPRLLEFIGLKASQKALDWLISKNVEVVLNESVNLNNVSDGVIQTSSGEVIAADCHFVCTAKPMGSSWLRESILQNDLDMQGRLMVDRNMRVRGHKNIFAVGDITDVKVSLTYLSVVFLVFFGFCYGSQYLVRNSLFEACGPDMFYSWTNRWW